MAMRVVGFFFDGVDDYASSSGVFTKLGTSNTPYTISGWIKVAPGETNGNIVHMASGSGGSGWCLPPMAMNSKRLKATSWNGGQISITDSFTMLEDVWYHFATTWDSINGLRLYRNGSLVANTAQAIYSASGSANYIFLGFSPGGCAGNEGMFNGAIDKVRFFDYSRTPTQIAWEYNQGLPFSYWKLDETSGSTVADITGNGATGTLVNGGTWVSGQYGNAISLDGSNDYVDFGNSLPNLSGWKQLSITGWFRSSSISGERTIISKFWEGDQGYGSSVYKIWTSGSEIRFKLSTNGSWDGLYVRASGITTGQWNHFAAIWDGAYYKIYLNGMLAEQKSRSGVLTNPGRKTTIGSVSDGTSSYFAGLVDDIRIYSYALNQTQIMESMHVR